MKKKALISSILTIALCLSLIAGSTFALFTSESSVNIAVTAGNVDVIATIDEDSLKLYSPTAIDMTGKITDNTNAAKDTTFVNGGTATLDGDTLTLENITPGDKVTFTIKIENKSNVSIIYRTSVSCDKENKGLLDALNINIGGTTVVSSSEWTELEANGEIADLECTVELPATAGNDYQGKSCALTFKIEAAQGNADPVVSVTDIDSLRAAIAAGGDIKLMDDITLTSEDCYEISETYGYCLVLAKTSANIDLNGYSISYKRDASKGDVNARFGIVAAAGATVNVYDSSDDQTGGITIDDDEEYCVANNLTSSGYALYAENGAVLNVYNGNYVTSNSVVAYARIGGTINIYGGTYKSSYYPGGEGTLLNIPNGTAATNKINVYGGSFEKFQPGVNNASEAILADGYKVEQSGDWYTVVLDTEINVTADTTLDMGGQTVALTDTEEAYVLKSDNSGAKITLKNATYTGEAQGIYFGEYLRGSNDYNFNTQADNVTVEDLKVSTNITNGSNKISAGVWVYGAFEFNNCSMSGTTTTESDCTPYDVAFVNHSHGTVNGGEYDSMFVYTMSEVSLKGVKVGKIACMTNTTVGKALTIDKDCVIDTVEFVGGANYVMNIVIEDGAQIGSIVYNGTTYTVAEWQAYVNQ